MKYFKDAHDTVFAFESDGSQDSFITGDLVPITLEQADALRIPATVVPGRITMRQARLALFQSGYLSQVDTLIASLPGDDGIAARIDWEFASDVERTHPLVVAMAATIPLDSTQLNELFTLGASL